MKRTLSLTIGIIMLLGTGLMARPFDGPGRGGPRHGGHGRMWFGDPVMMKERLGLSDGQIDRVITINRSVGEKLRPLHDKLREKRQNLRYELVKDTVDLGKVKTILKEISRLEVETRYLMISHRVQIEQVLTPEQRETLSRERSKRRRGRHGRQFRGDDD